MNYTFINYKNICLMKPVPTKPGKQYIARQLQDRLLFALQTSPVVFLRGPRQAGKSTLVRKMAESKFPAEYVTFDDMTQMAAASHSPEAYLKARKLPLIIDEVQIVPEIFRALKKVVDELRYHTKEKRTGRFLLTGSADVMAFPKLSDALVGRVGILTLHPLSSAEALRGSGNFLTRLFKQEFAVKKGSVKEIDEAIRCATFPEISGASVKECNAWFDGYLATLLQRDVRSLARVEKITRLPNLLRVLANRAGSLVNDADIARDVGLNHVTARNYKALLKALFLTFEIPPWYRNVGQRLVKTPKVYICDTLFLCYLLQHELSHLRENRPELFGHVLENFVATELLKLSSGSDQGFSIFHFRTSDHKEVDFVVERPDGKLAGLEVKSQDSVKPSDLKGLNKLRTLAGEDFVCGVVLYQGKEVVPLDKNLWAVPLSQLWATAVSD